MTTYQLAYNPTTKVAKIQTDGVAVGAGFTDIGSFDHFDDADDVLGSILPAGVENHALYHHIRDMLYGEGVQDMHAVSIRCLTESISVTPATKTLDISAGDTQILATAFTPSIAADQRVTYVSSDPTKATVDANGKITPVAAGETTITVTSVEGGKTDTCVVTVQA